MKLWSLLGNSQKLDGGAMFGNAPRAMWEKWSPPDAQNRIDLACRALLATPLAGKTVLFEAGIGAFFEPKLRERYGVNEERHVLLDSSSSLTFISTTPGAYSRIGRRALRRASSSRMRAMSSAASIGSVRVIRIRVTVPASLRNCRRCWNPPAVSNSSMARTRGCSAMRCVSISATGTRPG